MRHRTRSTIIGIAVSFILAIASTVPLSAATGIPELRVRIDQVTIVNLDKPGVEVIIGNPSIADVSVQNRKVLVVTGKSVGLTNLMVMDVNGSVIYDSKVSVTVDPKHLVTVNKGQARQTYSCAPTCSPALIPGDNPVFVEELNKAIQAKVGLAQASAEGSVGQQ